MTVQPTTKGTGKEAAEIRVRVKEGAGGELRGWRACRKWLKKEVCLVHRRVELRAKLGNNEAWDTKDAVFKESLGVLYVKVIEYFINRQGYGNVFEMGKFLLSFFTAIFRVNAEEILHYALEQKQADWEGRAWLLWGALGKEEMEVDVGLIINFFAERKIEDLEFGHIMLMKEMLKYEMAIETGRNVMKLLLIWMYKKMSDLVVSWELFMDYEDRYGMDIEMVDMLGRVLLKINEEASSGRIKLGDECVKMLTGMCYIFGGCSRGIKGKLMDRVIEMMQGMLEDGDWQVRLAGLEGLGEIGRGRGKNFMDLNCIINREINAYERYHKDEEYAEWGIGLLKLLEHWDREERFGT